MESSQGNAPCAQRFADASVHLLGRWTNRFGFFEFLRVPFAADSNNRKSKIKNQK